MGACASKPATKDDAAAAPNGVVPNPARWLLESATEPALLALILPRGSAWEDDYTISFKTLGVGKWGTVKMAVNRHTAKKVAFKVLKKKMLAKRPARISPIIELECHALACRHNKRVAKLEAVYEDDKNLYLAVEHCSGGDLYAYLVSYSKKFTEESIRKLARCAFQSVAECHACGLAHRDIKPENMLFGGNGDQLKLCDFGSAAKFQQGPKTNSFSDFVSTAWYTAPEIFTHSYSAQCDAWALGVTLHVLLTGPPPNFNSEQCKNDLTWIRMQKGEVSLPIGCSAQLRELISMLLEPDPMQRLTVGEALQHEWFTGIAPSQEVDLEGSMRGIKVFVHSRNMLRAAVLVVGVFLNEKQMGRLVHSIGQQQLQHISILRLEQLLMDMEETTCKIHLSEAKSRLEEKLKTMGGKETHLGDITMPVELFTQLLEHTREQEVWKRSSTKSTEAMSVGPLRADNRQPQMLSEMTREQTKQTQRDQLYDSVPNLTNQKGSLRSSWSSGNDLSSNGGSSVRVVFDATGGMPTLKVQVPEDSVSTVHGGNMIKQIMDGNLAKHGMGGGMGMKKSSSVACMSSVVARNQT